MRRLHQHQADSNARRKVDPIAHRPEIEPVAHDPLDRDPAIVLRDIGLGYYTVEQAADLFGVVIADGLDLAATLALRQSRKG